MEILEAPSERQELPACVCERERAEERNEDQSGVYVMAAGGKAVKTG